MEITWEDISRKLTDAADYTVKKTEKLTAIAKLEYKLANKKNKLNLLYQNLGKVKYSEMAGDAVDEIAYRELQEKIRCMLYTIERMEEQLAYLRNYRFCIACGAKIGNDMCYCPKCGTRQVPVEEDEASEAEEEIDQLSAENIEASEDKQAEE